MNRAGAQGRFISGHREPEFTQFLMKIGQVVVSVGVVRLAGDGLMELLDRLGKLPQSGQSVGEIVMGRRDGLVQFDRTPQHIGGAGELPQLTKCRAKIDGVRGHVRLAATGEEARRPRRPGCSPT